MSLLETLKKFVKQKYRLLSRVSLSIVGIYAARAFYCYIHRRHNKYPPGPNGLPVVGSLFSMLNIAHLQSYLATTYGSISMVYVAQQRFVFLHSIDLINEIFKNEHCVNRDQWHKGFLFDDHQPHELPSGTINKPFWTKKRKTLQSVLLSRLDSDFLNESHNTSITEIFESIQNCIQKNKLWYPFKDLEYIMLNAIWSAVFGSYLSFDSGIQHKILHFIRQISHQSLLDTVTMNLDLKTILPSWSPLFVFRQKQFNTYTETLIYKQLGYDQQIWNVNDSKWTKHFDDVYRDKESCLISKLIAIHRNKQDAESTKTGILTEVGVSLFGAGIETTTNVAEYGTVLLAKYPNDQDLIYNELYAVIGTDWKMKQISFKSVIHKLHYLRAFVYETLRLSNVLPIGVPHRNDVDIWTKDKKYKIPKDSVIISDIESANTCDPHWIQRTNGNPNDLCLKAWLDDKGHFSYNLNKDKLMSFSVGIRDCAGRALALRSLYVLFIKLILNFKFDLKHQHIEIRQKVTFTQHIHPKIGLKVTLR